jgi:hypothetical protein
MHVSRLQLGSDIAAVAVNIRTHSDGTFDSFFTRLTV